MLPRLDALLSAATRMPRPQAAISIASARPWSFFRLITMPTPQLAEAPVFQASAHPPIGTCKLHQGAKHV